MGNPPPIAVIDSGPLIHLHQIDRLAALEVYPLCRKLGVAILLTDDLAARKVATSLQIRPVGSLGVIVRAAVEGRIARAEAEESLLRLHTVSSLFVTPAIVDMAIEQLRLIV